MTFVSRTTKFLAAGVLALGLAACSGTAEDGGADATTLTVVTHDSFVLPDDLKDTFERESGLEVTYVAPGEGGALVNQLVLTKDSPLGDVVYGIDNTLSQRAVEAGVVEELRAIDFGDVCINADLEWFDEQGLPLPETLDDLADPAYRDLLVVTNPASSSPGLAFLAATVGAKGDDGYLDYWQSLVDNGVKVVQGWSEAYYTEFSGADGEGPRPLVLSYATSPAFTLTEDGSASTTAALLDTCFRQTEYAGVIAGAENPEGAEAFIDFLLSPEVQASIPDSMYMYPADESVELPADWVAFAPLATDPIEVPEDVISAERDQWIRDWTATVIG